MSDFTELKASTDRTIARISKFLKLEQFEKKLARETKRYYDRGIEDTGTSLNMNFSRVPERLDLIMAAAGDRIRDLNVEARNRLKRELTTSILNLETKQQAVQRVRGVLDTTTERAKMIVRTETVRAYNTAAVDAARQSGLALRKQWLAAEDERTCEVCGALHSKIVGVNEKFQAPNGEEFDIPPAHPNCRCTLVWIQE